MGCDANNEAMNIEVSCVNGDADRIRSANFEIVLNLRIFFWFGLHLFSRSDDSGRKLIDAL
jgi:hypothetical protein